MADLMKILKRLLNAYVALFQNGKGNYTVCKGSV